MNRLLRHRQMILIKQRGKCSETYLHRYLRRKLRAGEKTSGYPERLGKKLDVFYPGHQHRILPGIKIITIDPTLREFFDRRALDVVLERFQHGNGHGQCAALILQLLDLLVEPCQFILIFFNDPGQIVVCKCVGDSIQ